MRIYVVWVLAGMVALSTACSGGDDGSSDPSEVGTDNGTQDNSGDNATQDSGDDNGGTQNDQNSGDEGGERDDQSDGNGKDGPTPKADYCAVTKNWPKASADFEARVVELANVERAKGATCGNKEMGPAPAFSMELALQCAARVHSKDMGDKGYFDHKSRNGDSHTDRAKKAGTSAGSENIAWGQGTPEQVIASWMSSSGHCKNIMKKGHSRVGVGYYNGLWTMLLGG